MCWFAGGCWLLARLAGVRFLPISSRGKPARRIISWLTGLSTFPKVNSDRGRGRETCFKRLRESVSVSGESRWDGHAAAAEWVDVKPAALIPQLDYFASPDLCVFYVKESDWVLNLLVNSVPSPASFHSTCQPVEGASFLLRACVWLGEQTAGGRQGAPERRSVKAAASFMRSEGSGASF